MRVSAGFFSFQCCPALTYYVVLRKEEGITWERFYVENHVMLNCDADVGR